MIRLHNKNREKEIFRIDLAPMINIVFLLLIFFLLTSTAIKQGNSIHLPKSKTFEINHEKSIVISLNESNQLELDQEETSKSALLDKLSRLLETKEHKVVTIESDKKNVFKQVGDILEIARQAGAVDFILATEPMD